MDLTTAGLHTASKLAIQPMSAVQLGSLLILTRVQEDKSIEMTLILFPPYYCIYYCLVFFLHVAFDEGIE